MSQVTWRGISSISLWSLAFWVATLLQECIHAVRLGNADLEDGLAEALAGLIQESDEVDDASAAGAEDTEGLEDEELTPRLCGYSCGSPPNCGSCTGWTSSDWCLQSKERCGKCSGQWCGDGSAPAPPSYTPPAPPPYTPPAPPPYTPPDTGNPPDDGSQSNQNPAAPGDRCDSVHSPRESQCTGCPPMKDGKLCASTTRYNDQTKGSCGCGNSDPVPSTWWTKSKWTAAMNCKNLDPENPMLSWCPSQCGACYRLCSTGGTAQGATTKEGVCRVFKVDNRCGDGYGEGGGNWCSNEMSWQECQADPARCAQRGSTNQYGYTAHFDLQDLNGQISQVLGWDNVEVTFEPVSCSEWTGPSWDCQCPAGGDGGVGPGATGRGSVSTLSALLDRVREIKRERKHAAVEQKAKAGADHTAISGGGLFGGVTSESSQSADSSSEPSSEQDLSGGQDGDGKEQEGSASPAAAADKGDPLRRQVNKVGSTLASLDAMIQNIQPNIPQDQKSRLEKLQQLAEKVKSALEGEAAEGSSSEESQAPDEDASQDAAEVGQDEILQESSADEGQAGETVDSGAEQTDSPEQEEKVRDALKKELNMLVADTTQDLAKQSEDTPDPVDETQLEAPEQEQEPAPLEAPQKPAAQVLETSAQAKKDSESPDINAQLSAFLKEFTAKSKPSLLDVHNDVGVKAPERPVQDIGRKEVGSAAALLEALQRAQAQASHSASQVILSEAPQAAEAEDRRDEVSEQLKAEIAQLGREEDAASAEEQAALKRLATATALEKNAEQEHGHAKEEALIQLEEVEKTKAAKQRVEELVATANAAVSANAAGLMQTAQIDADNDELLEAARAAEAASAASDEALKRLATAVAVESSAAKEVKAATEEAELHAAERTKAHEASETLQSKLTALRESPERLL
eukprot:TRINITY_DN32788_c0_g2_i1.p1 TRINITY_DN32788_c0_g2~~TRINITY_DN32788_c0_g2_i1.p1  ORF type:complete len:913 (-),score=220.00 TRINITY_DN32788_c0_g2_i1:23-2761(-)